MSNVIGTASTTQQLQLEALNEVIKLLIEKEAKLDARISERGRYSSFAAQCPVLCELSSALPDRVSRQRLPVQPGRRYSAGRQLQRLGSGYSDSAGHCHSGRVLAAG